jgi:hypothetical protein
MRVVSLGVHRHYVPTDLQPNAVYHFRLRVHYRQVRPFHRIIIDSQTTFSPDHIAMLMMINSESTLIRRLIEATGKVLTSEVGRYAESKDVPYCRYAEPKDVTY